LPTAIEHTDQVLRKATLLQKLNRDHATGLRGFLTMGDQQLL